MLVLRQSIHVLHHSMHVLHHSIHVRCPMHVLLCQHCPAVPAARAAAPAHAPAGGAGCAPTPPPTPAAVVVPADAQQGRAPRALGNCKAQARQHRPHIGKAAANKPLDRVERRRGASAIGRLECGLADEHGAVLPHRRAPRQSVESWNG
eukprot:365308-Chlamydomonas_euryale.AAC.9